MTYDNLSAKKDIAKSWFSELRNSICNAFEDIETLSGNNTKFARKIWNREGGGGGEISIMKGEIFEKVGVNISTVWGNFSEKFAKEIPGCEKDNSFWASGISLVAHMNSPYMPAVHMNTRMIVTSKAWFGGGMDLTPVFSVNEDTDHFHKVLKDACDKFDENYYPSFKKNCDEYFFLPHRNEMRGVGGIFYDYLNTNNWDNDFDFTKDIGSAFLNAYLPIIKKYLDQKWTLEQKEQQLIKRGRYVEFNLLYDRGTKFGLMTGGNVEAILMSLPPEVKWI